MRSDVVGLDMEDEERTTFKVTIDFGSERAFREYIDGDRNMRNAESCLRAFHEWLRGQYKYNDTDITQEVIYEKLGEHLEAYDVDLYGEW